MRPKALPLILILLAAALAGCAENGGDNGGAGGGDDPAAAGSTCTSTTDESLKAAQPAWVLDTTMGTIRVTLFCDKTPVTAQNFVKLTEQGHFDGTKFHRVIKDFMNQGGDPLTKDDSKASQWGTGGPGYTIKDEFYCADGSVSNTHPATCPSGLGLKHDKPGILSMANTGRPATGGSQFFLTAVPTPWLDGKHSVFGQVADQESLDVVLAINRVPTDQGDRPTTPVVIRSAEIDWGTGATRGGASAGAGSPTPSPSPSPSPSPVADDAGAAGDKAEAGDARCVSTAADGKAAARPAWVLDTTMGTIRVTLFCDKTPLTAQHFVNLTEEAYFDGTKFHRVIEDFMNQGGDPLTKDDSQAARWGTGGPGYTIKDEFYCADGTVSYTHPATCPSGLGLKHDKPGILSMANTGRPATGGSQFFLTAVPTAWLDGKHAVFGEVADQESLDVVLAINRVPTGPGDRPTTPVVIRSATLDWGA